MNLVRTAFVVSSLLVSSGAAYLGYMGIGGESMDTDRSIRVGSGGNTFQNANVK